MATPHQLRQQVEGCSNKLDILGKDLKMFKVGAGQVHQLEKEEVLVGDFADLLTSRTWTNPSLSSTTNWTFSSPSQTEMSRITESS